MAAAWQRNLFQSARWYVEYFERRGAYDAVAYEALEVLSRLGKEAAELRGALLSLVSERLVGRPESEELAELVYRLAEAQADAGVDVSEDFGLLWASYEKAFEQQLAVDGEVNPSLVARFRQLHERLGNDEDWVRIHVRLADFYPGVPEYRLQLADFLTARERHQEALCNEMALWLTNPLSSGQTERLGGSAQRAGEQALAERAAVWGEFLRGGALPTTPLRSGAVARLLLHAELRPFEPWLVQLAGGFTGDRKAIVIEALRRCERGEVSQEQWKQFESLARRFPLTPAMQAALAVAPGNAAWSQHPLRAAARLSLDRFLLAGAGWQELDFVGPSVNLLQTADGEQSRFALYRLRELAKFFFSRAWECEPVELPEDPVADLLEALYSHGMPDASTRSFLFDVRRKRKIPSATWEATERQVRYFLRLEAYKAEHSAAD